MLIAENVNVKVCVFDIETLKEMFDIGIYDPESKEWIEFEISKNKNDLYKIVSYYQSNPYGFWISFNGVKFDHQVMQFILDNYQDWWDFTNLQMCGKIYEFVQRLIDDQKYDIPPPYAESAFPVSPIDVFAIHHFDNEARRTSLKWCAFMLNMEVEEMPIFHGKDNLTDEEITSVKKYRRNDCLVTLGVFYLTLGRIDKILELNGGFSLNELKDYSGKNKIQDRIDTMRETGLMCMNWSDVKIGEEWNKLDYKEAENITDNLALFPKKVRQPFGQKIKNFFPSTVRFKTENLRNFQHIFGEAFVLAKKQTFPVKVGKTDYTVAKGGIHSNEKPRGIITSAGMRCVDADVGSQYPRFIEKNRIFPPHLKDTIINQFGHKIAKRISYKKKGNELKAQGKESEARPYISVQEMLKLCLNGGYYGKLNQPGSFLQYPEGYMKVTVGCQMEILLLIEMLESEGISVISGNTDGVVSYFPDKKTDEYIRICNEWQSIVGNSTQGKLEFTDFEGFWQESINSYIAKKTDGAVKKKGRFLTEFELNKNKSKRIIALALEAYFIHKKNPIDFISEHKNIFDFCIAKKTNGQLHFEEVIDTGDRNNPEIVKHKKLLVYYISNDGNVLMKRGINNEGDEMNNHCEAIDKDFPWMGQPKVKYFNKIIKHDDISKYNINYSYYILETLKRIDSIEKTKKAKNYADSFKTKQGGLF